MQFKTNGGVTGVTYIAYEVQPKETLIVCQNFGMSQEGFIALNPQLKAGVEIGIKGALSSPAQKRRKEALSKKITITKKNGASLPFNISR
jgi:hypothetical protein